MTEKLQLTKTVFALDCESAQRLAEFYAALLGWTIMHPSPDVDGAEAEWVDVVPPNQADSAFKLACQTVQNYRAPQWRGSDVPAQAHLDFHVPALAEALPHALAVGATEAQVQPSENGSFRVLLDPAGHPFCLCEVP
ncbi:MAG: VOC family protein [Canibacter sp.]